MNHQNGKAERHIGDVTQETNISLLHASYRWTTAIHSSLWPSAMKNYVNLRNSIPSKYVPGGKQGRRKLPDTLIRSPLSKIYGIETPDSLIKFYPLGSPVFVLQPKPQAQQFYSKWPDRSHVGILPCHSLNHSSSVPSILNTTTGTVSPQFHCLMMIHLLLVKQMPNFPPFGNSKRESKMSPRQSFII